MRAEEYQPYAEAEILRAKVENPWADVTMPILAPGAHIEKLKINYIH